MATLIDIDLAESFPAQGDIVRLTNGRFDWVVQKSLPYTNTLYVESTVGKRQAIARVTDVLTIKRDPDFVSEPDWSWEYSDGE